ncbi:hypothetical protein ACLOJK_013603 [Asimina triloba]
MGSDVCKGDVVLFTQRVYKKFDIVSRAGDPIGKRTIAGRVVKESYGAAKQQHTFTVEILWCKGVKKLPPLFPLLVKGRNLYRLKTFRQRWDDEAERLKVLAEKHRRGAAARQIRAMKKAKSAVRGAKHGKHSCHATLQSKPQKSKVHCKAQNHDTGSSNGLSSREQKADRNSKTRASKSLSSKRKRHCGHTDTLSPSKRQRKLEPTPATAKKTKHNINKSKVSPLMVGGLEIQAKQRASESISEYLQHVNHQRDELPAFQLAAQNDNSYNHPHPHPHPHPHMQHQISIPPVSISMQLHQGRIPPACIFSGGIHPSSSYEVGSTSIGGQLFARQPTAMHTHHPSVNHIQHFSNAGPNSSTWLDPSSHLRNQVGIDKQIHANPRAGQATVPKSNSLVCPTPGCKDMGAKTCVGSLCWNCCRRRGWKCSRHKLH